MFVYGHIHVFDERQKTPCLSAKNGNNRARPRSTKSGYSQLHPKQKISS